MRRGDREDVAKEVGHQVGRISGGEVYEEDADCHACRPENADEGILADFPPCAEALDAQGGEEGKAGGAEHGGQSEVEGQPEPAEGGVGDAPADEYHAAGNNVGAHEPAADADEEGGEKGVLEEVVVE